MWTLTVCMHGTCLFVCILVCLCISHVDQIFFLAGIPYVVSLLVRALYNWHFCQEWWMRSYWIWASDHHYVLRCGHYLVLWLSVSCDRRAVVITRRWTVQSDRAARYSRLRRVMIMLQSASVLFTRSVTKILVRGKNRSGRTAFGDKNGPAGLKLAPKIVRAI